MNNQKKETALLQSIFDASIEGILVVDDAGRILDANGSCERMFGYSKGELKDTKLENLLPEKFRKKHGVHRKKYVKKPETRTMGLGLDLWGLKKKGSEFPLDISLSPTTLNGKQVTVAFVKDATSRMMDMTALQETNAFLAESNRKLNTLVGNLQGIVYRCKNDRDWTMEYISEGCRQVTGHPPKDFLEGKVHFSDLTFKEDQEPIWSITQKSLDKKKPFTVTYRIRDKRGKVKYLRELGQGIFDKKGSLIALEGFISDITEQKKGEEELRQNEAKNNALLEALPDMMFILDHDGNYLDYFTPEPEKLLVPQEELIGKNRKDVLPPEVYKVVKKAHDLTIKTQKLQVTEYSLNLPTGRFDYEARTVPLNNHALLSIVRDVTENRKTEQELRESEAKNRAILGVLPDLILIHDKDGKTLEIQASDPSLLIAPKEKLIGKNVKRYLPLAAADKILKALKEVHETKKMLAIEVTVPGIKRQIDFEARSVPFGKDKILSVARDISKGTALKKILDIRNNALEAAGNGILIVDAQLPDFPIIYCNDAFVKITGYNKSEVLGKNCRFLQNNDREQEGIALMRTALKKQQACQVILRNYRKDGTLFWNELTITPVNDKNGELTHFIGVQNDITERKKAELLKDQIQVVLELITEDQPLSEIAHKIIETVEKHLSNCMASILLLDEEKGTLNILAAPNLPDSFSKGIVGVKIEDEINCCSKAVYIKKEVIVGDIANEPLCPDYKQLAMKHDIKSCWSSPIFSSQKKVLGTFAIYCDDVRTPTKGEREIVANMTQLTSVAIERHNVNKALRKSKEQLEEKVAQRTNEITATVEKLVEANQSLENQIETTKVAENRAMASQALFAAIAQNFPKGVISVFNTNMEVVYLEGEELQKFKLDKNDYEGKSINDLPVITKELKEQIKQDVQKTLSGEHLSFEMTYGKQNYSVNSIPLYADKNITWALFVHTNTTDQKRVQLELLKALQTEQELNELKSRFISMASHEFRTPLSAILSSAILIGKQNEPGKEEKRKKYIKQIKSNVRNLVVILNDFLSLSKLEEGKTALQLADFDLVELTQSVIDEIETSQKEGQTLILEHEQPAVSVFLDAKLMRHILINLISNAIKYSEENSKIYVGISATEDKVSLQVADEGMGIPIEEQDNLFERFFRAKNATNIQGTGLGLHIVKQYTELMGGTISFKSKLGKGAIFYVDFPVAGRR